MRGDHGIRRPSLPTASPAASSTPSFDKSRRYVRLQLCSVGDVKFAEDAQRVAAGAKPKVHSVDARFVLSLWLVSRETGREWSVRKGRHGLVMGGRRERESDCEEWTGTPCWTLCIRGLCVSAALRHINVLQIRVVTILVAVHRATPFGLCVFRTAAQRFLPDSCGLRLHLQQ
jgi:hypothetical protein